MNWRQELALWIFGLASAVLYAAYRDDKEPFERTLLILVSTIGVLSFWSLRTRPAKTTTPTPAAQRILGAIEMVLTNETVIGTVLTIAIVLVAWLLTKIAR